MHWPGRRAGENTNGQTRTSNRTTTTTTATAAATQPQPPPHHTSPHTAITLQPFEQRVVLRRHDWYVFSYTPVAVPLFDSGHPILTVGLSFLANAFLLCWHVVEENRWTKKLGSAKP
jgi:hypothetical protein